MSVEWVAEFFRDADQVQIDKLAAWFADDIDLRFANNPPIQDKQTAVHVMGEFYNSISAMSHAPVAMTGEGDTVTQVATVTYTRLDGKVFPFPVASYMHRNSAGKLDKLWIYIDVTPMYADAAAL